MFPGPPAYIFLPLVYHIFVNPPLLPDQSLVVKVPDNNVSVTAAGEADLVVGGDGERVAGRGGRRQLRFDARSGSGQIPDGQRAGLAANDQRPSIRQQLAGADVVISVLIGRVNNSRSGKLE